MTKHIFILSALSAFLALAGCSPSGPAVHAVKGQVELTGGDIAPLAGHIVEVALASDPSVRADFIAVTFGNVRSASRDGSRYGQDITEADATNSENVVAAIDPPADGDQQRACPRPN